MASLTEDPLAPLVFAIGKLIMRMEFERISAGMTGPAFNPEVMQDGTCTVARHMRRVERGERVRHGRTHVLNGGSVQIVGTGGQLKARDPGRDRVNVIADHARMAPPRFHETRSATYKRIQHKSSTERNGVQIGLPKPVGVLCA